MTILDLKIKAAQRARWLAGTWGARSTWDPHDPWEPWDSLDLWDTWDNLSGWPIADDIHLTLLDELNDPR